jgi:hypothetical protein
LSSVAPTPDSDPANSSAPVLSLIPPAETKPSFFRRVIAKVSAVESSVLHDPLVQKEGKSLFGAVVVRIALAAGASAGTVALVEAILHAAGV